MLESLQCFAPQIFRPTAKERDNPDIIDDVKVSAPCLSYLAAGSEQQGRTGGPERVEYDNVCA